MSSCESFYIFFSLASQISKSGKTGHNLTNEGLIKIVVIMSKLEYQQAEIVF